MKKLILGFALALFLGTFTVSANLDNPPKDKQKTESCANKTTASADKKDCSQASADKKAGCSDKATTASAEKSCCSKEKKTETASVNTK